MAMATITAAITNAIREAVKPGHQLLPATNNNNNSTGSSSISSNYSNNVLAH